MNDKLSAGEREALADLLATDPPTSAVVWVVERILAASLADADARLAAVEALADEWERRDGPTASDDMYADLLRAALRPDPSEDA